MIIRSEAARDWSMPCEEIALSSLKLIGALLVAIVLVVFGVQNTQAVTFHFLMFKAPSTPMVLALFVAALLGALLGWIVSAPGRFHRMRERRDLQAQVATHERVDAARGRSATPEDYQAGMESE
jgi:uncharacterized integral membrane protein